MPTQNAEKAEAGLVPAAGSATVYCTRDPDPVEFDTK
jgi:hypothetical protein